MLLGARQAYLIDLRVLAMPTWTITPKDVS